MNINTDMPAESSRERPLVELWAKHGALGSSRTAHDAMALGAQLLLVKGVTPHGEFKDRVNSLGLSASTAQHYMAVARRFFHLPDTFFDIVGTASDLMQLLPLQDEDVNALARGEEVAGLSPAALANATVQSLRKAVREVQAQEMGDDPQPMKGRLSVEEERILRLFRKCDPAGKDALLRAARVMHKP